MSDLPPVIGFAGTAPITPARIAANLEDLPDEVILVLPGTIPAGSGLSAVLDWLTDEYEEGDINYADGVIVSTLEQYADKGHEVTLMLLLNPADALDHELWAWAAAEGITVTDLAQNNITLGAPPQDLPGQETEEEEPAITVPEPTTRPARVILDDIRLLIESIKSLLTEFEQTPEYQEGSMKGAPGFPGPQIAQHIAAAAVEDPAPPLPADSTVERFKWTKSPEGMYSPRRRGRLARGYTLVMLTREEIDRLRGEGKVIEAGS